MTDSVTAPRMIIRGAPMPTKMRRASRDLLFFEFMLFMIQINAKSSDLRAYH